MRPTEIHGLLRGFSAEQSVNETRREAVAAADAVQDVQFARRRVEGLAVDPGHRPPTVAIGGVNFPQGGGDDSDMGMFLRHAAHHAEKRCRVQAVGRLNLRPRNIKAKLQILLVSDEHVHMLDNAVEHLFGAVVPAGAVPEFGAVIQVERGDGPGRLRRL